MILTANYTFLNYLVLVLGVLLLDDRLLRRFLPARFRRTFPELPEPASLEDEITRAEAGGSCRRTALRPVGGILARCVWLSPR